MKSINLIPAHRLAARRRRALRNRCIVGCTTYGVVVLAACGAGHVLLGKTDPLVAGRLVDVAEDIERTGKNITTVKAELDAAQSTLRASRSISEQPDWSALMALLASRAGDEIVLKSCVVRPREMPAAPLVPEPKKPGAKPPPPAPAAPAEPSMVLTASGMGLSPPAVSKFILRLEASRLFAKVTLLDTNREPYDKGEAIAFRIECSLDEPAAAPLPPGSVAALAPVANAPRPIGPKPPTRPAVVAATTRPTTGTVAAGAVTNGPAPKPGDARPAGTPVRLPPPPHRASASRSPRPSGTPATQPGARAPIIAAGDTGEAEGSTKP